MQTLQQIKRIITIIVGFTVLLVGVALIVLPGPAFVVIPVGLAILSVEFAWARRWLQKAKDMAAKAVAGRKKNGNGTPANDAPKQD